MLDKEVSDLYKKFRLVHYRELFGRIREKDGSLSATEAYAADVIYLLGTPTIKQFADFLGISQPNATYKVNCLVSKGYVTKVTSDEDRREFLLHVSDRFYNYYDTRNSFIQDACDRLREEFTPEELDTFEKMLWSLNKAVRPGASKAAEENNGRE